VRPASLIRRCADALRARRPTRHRIKCWLALGIGGLATCPSCTKGPTIATRVVTTHVPQACAVGGTAYAEYYALGDFEPPAPPATGHLLAATGEALPEVYDQTRALFVTARQSNRGWEGVAPVAAAGDVDVLVLPTLASCPLSASVGQRTGSTVAPIGDERVLVVGGTGKTTPPTYVARLDTGEVERLDGASDLLNVRTGATVTPFAGGAIVAGGMQGNSPLDTAEVYSAAAGGFDHQPFPLTRKRTQHGAVVLASGQTLLVGGRNDTDGLLLAMEIVDPVQRKAYVEGVGNLAFGRVDPTVLRLASGEILVAGGFALNGMPIETLEWFEADGTPSAKQSPPLAQGPLRSFLSLEAGGALAVVTPPAGADSSFQNVWVIDATGALEAATPVTGALTNPVLFGGAGGAPILWTGDRWLRWQPYAGSFGVAGVLDDVPAAVGAAQAAPDGGLALWLDDSQDLLTLLRFDTRGPYSTLPGPLLVAGPEETAPDRASGATWTADVGLILDGGSPGAGVFVTDRTYADVAIDVTAPTGEPALVALRDDQGNELDVGSPACPAVGATPGSKMHVERHGSTVVYSVDGGATQSCPATFASTSRVSVGLRGRSSARGVAKNLVVTRLGAP
jgi:hypothetical protein